MTRFYLPIATLTALLLTGCATMVEESSQKVNFLAVGATEVMCDIDTGTLKYRVNPPETLVIKKSRRDLNISCMAAGNRLKSMTVPSSLSGWTFGNVVAGAVIPGALYDGESGAMFKYPEIIVIDFSDTIAQPSSMPAYHAPDTLNPSISNNVDDYGTSRLRLPGDDAVGLRRKMANLQYERDLAADQALETEREARKSSLEGGWTGDKGRSQTQASAGGDSASPSYVPPAYTPPVVDEGTAQPPVPESTNGNNGQ